MSVSTGGALGNGRSYFASLAEDGRFVAFCSSATNLVAGDTNGVTDVFVRDRQLGTTQRVSVDSSGAEANGASLCPVDISASGRFVAFVSKATNLVPGDTDGENGVFVHDRQTRIIEKLATTGDSLDSTTGPSMSAGGHFVAFQSKARNLVPGDIGKDDVFLHNRQDGTNVWIGVTRAGPNIRPRISADGVFVAFGSFLRRDGGGNHYRAVVYNRLEETYEDEKQPGQRIEINADGHFLAFGDTVLDRRTRGNRRREWIDRGFFDQRRRSLRGV